MTKLQALNESIELWLWMYATGERSKVGWPGWKINGGHIKEYLNLCPLCQYTLGRGKHLNCDKCLVEWTGKEYELDDTFCEEVSSSYYEWLDEASLMVDNMDRTKEAAKRVLDLLIRTKEELHDKR